MTTYLGAEEMIYSLQEMAIISYLGGQERTNFLEVQGTISWRAALMLINSIAGME